MIQYIYKEKLPQKCGNGYIFKEGTSVTKHIFIVNPAAGKGFEAAHISEVISDACEVCGVDYEIHKTTSRLDASAFTRAQILSKPPHIDYRFYACGGDGTLSDVLNGAVDETIGGPIPGVSIGCVPIGTGNDFVRCFNQSEFFLDITKQLLADPITIDCFKLDGNTDQSCRFGINMVNIGFDCEVVCKTAELKRHRWLPKSLAYILGVISMLKQNPGQTITVTHSDGSVETREFELAAVANGGFCGGGFHSAPASRLDDSLLDVSLIKKVSRLEFLRLVGRYKKGTHLGTRLGRRIVDYSKTESIALSFPSETNVCIDGEILRLKSLELHIVPRAVSFLIPVGSEYKGN